MFEVEVFNSSGGKLVVVRVLYPKVHLVQQ